MIKPPDFDPSKKYPVFEFTYSGPHAPSVANRWGGSRGMWFQMLAEKGYIVWVCDNRTASGKGAESVWPIYKNMYSSSCAISRTASITSRRCPTSTAHASACTAGATAAR